MKFSIEIEHGKVLHIVVLAISELMIETGEREVFFQVNGQLRSMKVKDKAAIKNHKVHLKVDKNNKNQIGKLESVLSKFLAGMISGRASSYKIFKK